MPDNIIELNKRNFGSSVKKGKWIIDFWAVWCGPCKIMKPEFEDAAKELKRKVNFAEVNVDENYELADRFRIMSIPTTLFFNEGEVVHATTGAINKEQILELAEDVFK